MRNKVIAATLTVAAVTTNSAALANDWPSGFSKCADEGGRCNAGAVPHRVSYGIKNKWVTLVTKGTVACGTAVFGSDPFPGVTKKCAVGPASAPPTPTPDPVSESAPTTGWASQFGGTQGGGAAASNAVYLVSSASQLQQILKAESGKPIQIKIYGNIDMAAPENGGRFTSESDQAARGLIALPSHSTLIGVGANAGIANGNIMIKNVDNVIVRNLSIANPCDVAPKWDPKDGSSGNWNSNFDGITIDGASHVWIDHNSLTDAPVTDDTLPTENGKLKQCHDGAVDIKNGADYVTLSHNVFKLHDKNNLVGSSDGSTTDENHLTVTFNNNYFQNVTQRAPRVRFGRVHIYNNYYQGSLLTGIYRHTYSIGVGYKAKIVSQQNVFDIVKNPGNSSKVGAIIDVGSLLNGSALGVGGAACNFRAAVGWTVPYTPNVLAAAKVRESVLNNAGVGKLNVR